MYQYDPSKACKSLYNPKVDLHEVDQFGFVDLNKAYVDGTISGDVAISDERFNGVQDPSTLLPRPKDKFEAMRQADYVKAQLKSSKKAAESETKQVTSEAKVTE